MQLVIAFRQRDTDGTRLRQGPPEIATILGVDLPRADRLLRSAMRAVPLAADQDPIDVLYEDDDLLAVNKPPGVISAPKHRYTGGSMVNRVIGARGVEPHVIHRLDMNTSGVLLFAKSKEVVRVLHAQFRARKVKKRYLALVAGVPGWTTREVDGAIGLSDVEK